MAETDPGLVVDMLTRRAAAKQLDADSAIDLADAALDSGREGDALSAVVAAAQRYQVHAGLWQWAGLLYRELDQHRRALVAFDRAAALAPGDPLILHSRARVRLEAGLPAVANFELARKFAPANDDVLLGAAAAYCAEGLAYRAIANIDARLAMKPGWLAGHEVVARMRWQHGQRDAFTLSVERALAEMPHSAPLWRTLLVLLIHADRFEEALAAAARARAMIGDHLVVLANEAAALSELGRAAAADSIYARIADSDDVTLAVRHIRHLLRTGRVEEAAQRAEPLVHHPSAHLIWPYLGLAWRLLGDSRWQWLEGDPALVGIFDLKDALPSLDAVGELLRGLHHATFQPLDQSLRGGTQTDGMLFQRIEPEIQALRVGIVDAVATHIARLPPQDPAHPLLRFRRDRPVRFSGAWSVRLTDAGYHANHNHPAGWMSSALYVTLPRTTPNDAPHAGSLVLGVPQAELGLDLPPIRIVETKPGRLVLFPSTMWHGTRPFTAGERITVAFDVAMPSLLS